MILDFVVFHHKENPKTQLLPTRPSSSVVSVADPNINRAVVEHNEESYADHRTSAVHQLYHRTRAVFWFSTVYPCTLSAGEHPTQRALFCPGGPLTSHLSRDQSGHQLIFRGSNLICQKLILHRLLA